MSPVSPPFFSIVVVCLNPGLRLCATLESVWSQRGGDREIIVVDGGSTDGSREWLEKQSDRLATFISESDAGVYDAMNKGVKAARGEWVIFLGADDQLAGDQVLAEVAAALKKDSAPRVAVGEAVYEDGRVYRLAPSPVPIARNFVHHQAAFYHRSVFAEHGGYDASLAIMGDYDFNLRLWQKGVRFTALPLRVALCGRGGLSDAGRWRGYREEIRVRHRYFKRWRCWGWDGVTLMRFLRKKAVRSFPGHG